MTDKIGKGDGLGVRVLRTPPHRRWIFIAAGVGFAAIGFFYAYAGVGLASVVALLGVLMVLVNGARLVPGANYLRLNQDGFEVCAFFRREAVRWRDVRRFTIAKGITGRRVAYILAPSDDPDLDRRLTRAFSGEDGTLPETYGMSAQALLDLLNGWRTRSITGR
jgi:hypothetical protein